MSMTPCNYCTFERMKEAAALRSNTYIKRARPLMPYFPDGVEVFEVSQESVDSHRTFLVSETSDAWFAELPSTCQC